ncbi:hypothetical protein [Methylobacter psychrophilus]|uniref:hypothetical protein n=1 Tax=Methylobacter psychrophilus TaxID=96941 RepID=UPI0021D50C41|nr:hypothetical protein [Methylobacter psychrophilus]
MGIFDSTHSERTINGSPIDWEGWKSRKDITPAQSARLAHRFDPNLWPDKTNALGVIVVANALGVVPDKELKAIHRLEWKLENKQKVYTLEELVIFLQSYVLEAGEDAEPKDKGDVSIERKFHIPVRMLVAVSQSVNNATTPVQQRSGKYGERDRDASLWLTTVTPGFVEALTIPEIKAVLVSRNKALWGQGFDDWNREQTVWPKKKAGVKRK